MKKNDIDRLEMTFLNMLVRSSSYNRITRRELARGLGVSDREVRLIREGLLRKGYWICSDNGVGYWIARNQGDKVAFYKYYISRALTILKTLRLLSDSMTRQVVMDFLDATEGEGGVE